jgi:hypothetical protein
MTQSPTDAPGGQAQQGHTENPAFGLGVTAEFTERVRLNQRKLRADLKGQYDFIEGVSERPGPPHRTFMACGEHAETDSTVSRGVALS